jgi:diaminopimelate decarboxylase
LLLTFGHKKIEISGELRAFLPVRWTPKVALFWVGYVESIFNGRAGKTFSGVGVAFARRRFSGTRINTSGFASMFKYENGQLACQGVTANELVSQFGTPLFVYDLDQMLERYGRFEKAFAPLKKENGGPGFSVAYACKANSHQALQQTLAEAGSWFDIVSGGELLRLQKLDVDPGKMVFAGVGKSREEIKLAGEAGIYAYNVESPAEVSRINDVGTELGKTLPIHLRVNPEVDAVTHKHITTGTKGDKFGIAMDEARAVLKKIKAGEFPNVRFRGFHAHIGSQITLPDRHSKSLESLMQFIDGLRQDGLVDSIDTLDMGGGFGIGYEPGKNELDIQAIADSLMPRLMELGLHLILEPGRYIIGPSGTLLTKVEYIKLGHGKRFVIVDAAMTELIRPSIYEAYHHILSAKQPASDDPMSTADIVGPVCESTDFLAKNREFPQVEEGDVLAIQDAGAYAIVMGSTYNTRPRPAEIAIKDGKASLISERQSLEAIFDFESTLSEAKTL